MILEIADFRIQPGGQAQFDTAIEHGLGGLDRDSRRL
jgi:hypothetical protein